MTVYGEVLGLRMGPYLPSILIIVAFGGGDGARCAPPHDYGHA